MISLFKIGHTINQQKYEENLKRLLESAEENLAWHWVSYI